MAPFPSEAKKTLSSFLISEQQVEIPGFSNLIIYRCDYNNTLYSQDLFKQLGVPFPESIKQAVDKRQAEFLAGRYAAIRALERLGTRVTNIASGHHRNPVWPSGILGSITHTTNDALSAVGYRTDFEYIGIDYEKVISCSVANEIGPIIINEFERKQLKKYSMSFENALTLAFSAKESLFKALYPKIGRYFDFNAAEIASLSEKQNSFVIRLTEALNQELTKGRLFTGYYQSTEQDVLTVIAG